MTTGHIDPRYGDASATAPPWDTVERLLTDAQLYWIVTVRADGRPHAVPLVGVWYDGAFAFCTGPDEQKHRNLEGNAAGRGDHRQHRCAGLEHRQGRRRGGHRRAGHRRRDPADAGGRLARPSTRDDWRYAVRGEEFVEVSHSGGSTGGAWVYRVEPAKVMVFGDDHGQTTYRL